MKYFIVRTMYDTYDFAKDGVVALGWEKVTFADKVNDINALIEEVRHEYYSDRKFSNQIIGRKLNEIRRFMNIQKDDVVVVPCGDSFMIGQSTGKYVTKHSRISENGHLYNQLKIDFICKDGSPLRFKRKGKNTALTTKLGCRGFTVLSITDPVIIREIDNLRKSQNDLSTSTILGHKEELEKEETVKAIHKALQNYSATSLDAHGIGFEKLIAKLFEVNGYDSYILSKQCGEDKADADILTINRSLLGDEFTTAYYIQAKHYYGNTGDYGLTQIKEYKKQLKKQAENGFIELKEKDSDQTIPVHINNIRCCFITSGVFTDDVKTSASEHSIILIEGEALAKLIFDNLDKLGEFKYQLGFIKKYEQIS